MLITKDQFLHFANRLAHCYRERNQFHSDMKRYFDSPVCIYLEQAIAGLEELLTVVSECEDEDDIFRWWIEECNKDACVITVRDPNGGDEKDYDVLTAEGLYNYLYDMYHHKLPEVTKPKGQWVIDDYTHRYRCSICNGYKPYDSVADYIDYWDCAYCPNCGAEMEVE